MLVPLASPAGRIGPTESLLRRADALFPGTAALPFATGCALNVQLPTGPSPVAGTPPASAVFPPAIAGKIRNAPERLKG